MGEKQGIVTGVNRPPPPLPPFSPQPVGIEGAESNGIGTEKTTKQKVQFVVPSNLVQKKVGLSFFLSTHLTLQLHKGIMFSKHKAYS